MEVTARKTVEKDGKKVPGDGVTVNVNIPSGLDAKVELFGADVVDAAAEDSLVITVQALMRRMLAKGKTQEEIQTAVDAWKPDVRTLVKQSAFEKASKAIGSLTAEERKALLEKLQAA